MKKLLTFIFILLVGYIYGQDSISVSLSGTLTGKIPKPKPDTVYVDRVCPVCPPCPGQKNDSIIASIYVDGLDSWLGNITTENQNLSYMQRNGFNGMRLYDLGLILNKSVARDNQLAAFIKRAREQYGFVYIEGTSGGGQSSINARVAFNLSRVNPNEKLDGINLEWEAWRQTDLFAAMITDSTYVVQMGNGAKSVGITSDQYWGWLKFTPFLTRMPIVLMKNNSKISHHYYQKNPDAAYHKQENDTMNAVAKRIGITFTTNPIFSAEPDFSQDTLKKITATQLYLNYSKSFNKYNYTNLKLIDKNGKYIFYMFDLSFYKVAKPDVLASPTLRTIPFKNVTTPEHLKLANPDN